MGIAGFHDDVVCALCLRGGGGKLSDRSATDDGNRLAGTCPSETDAVPCDRCRLSEGGVRDVEPGRYLEHLVGRHLELLDHAAVAHDAQRHLGGLMAEVVPSLAAEVTVAAAELPFDEHRGAVCLAACEFVSENPFGA